MTITTANDIRKIERVIDTALQQHLDWYEDLMRRLICHLPLPDSVLTKDAHCQCAFGHWFYGMGKAYIEQIPAFQRLGELHKDMHDGARQICQKSNSLGHVQEMDYVLFLRTLKNFRQELAAFKDRVLLTEEEVEVEAKAKAKEEAAMTEEAAKVESAAKEEATVTGKAEAPDKAEATDQAPAPDKDST